MTNLTRGEYIEPSEYGPVVLDRDDKDAWRFLRPEDARNWNLMMAGKQHRAAIKFKADAKWHIEQSRNLSELGIDNLAHQEFNEACRLTRLAIDRTRGAVSYAHEADRYVMAMAAE